MERLALKNSARLRYVTFFYLYIMQGIPAGFALTAVGNYLLGRHMPPQNVGAFIAIFGLPWTFQFIWGPIIDRFQYSSIGHRKHWVVMSQILSVMASSTLMILKDPFTELHLMGAIFFFYSVFASIEVASVDAMAISIAPLEQRGRLNGCMRGGFLMGSAFGAAALSFMLHERGFQAAALIQSAILFVFTVFFFFTRIDPADTLTPWKAKHAIRAATDMENPKFSVLFKRIYAAIIDQKSLKYFAFVATIYLCSSVFIRSYTFYLINVLQWPDKTVSLLQGSWGSIITLVAIFIAGALSDKIGAKKLQLIGFWSVCVFLLVLNSSYQLWRYKIYSGTALILWNIADPLLSVTVFPILMGLCWKRVEGSQFTTYLALINLCDVIGSYVTGWCVNFIAANLLGLLCGLVMLFLLLTFRMRGNYRIIPD